MPDKIELTPGQKILFIGDSITDADRTYVEAQRRPPCRFSGAQRRKSNGSTYKPFGFGYVHFVANFLLARYPAYNLNIINRGIIGNTIRDLKSRWQRDVVAELRGEASKHSVGAWRRPPCLFSGGKIMGADPHVVFPEAKRSEVSSDEGKSCGGLSLNPDILSILIGVNDVWRRFEEGKLSRAVFIDEYEATYRRLLEDVKLKCNSRLVICEPFMFCDDLNNPVFIELRRFVEVVRTIAADFNAVLVPLQTAIDEQIKTVPPQKWSADSVHPELWAHAWLAQQWLKAVKI